MVSVKVQQVKTRATAEGEVIVELAIITNNSTSVRYISDSDINAKQNVYKRDKC